MYARNSILSGLCSNCKLRSSAIAFQMRIDHCGSSVVFLRSQANQWLKPGSAWLETFEEHERLKVGLEVFSPLETYSGPYFFLELLKCTRKCPLDHWVVWLSCSDKLRPLDVLFACFFNRGLSFDLVQLLIHTRMSVLWYITDEELKAHAMSG